MDFSRSSEHKAMMEAVQKVAERYDAAYWHKQRETGEFPGEFWQDLADGGWLGVAIPEAYGGLGLGMQEMCLIIEAIGAAGAWQAGLLFVLTPVFGGESITVHGSEEQKQRFLPGIASGDLRWCLGVTEPDAGLNTANISTRAKRDGDGYRLSGKKTFISGAKEADYGTFIARTTPVSEVKRPTEGITVFLVDMNRPGIEFRQIPLDGYFSEPVYEVFLDEVHVPADMVLGEVDKGLYHIFDTLNTERVTIASGLIGTGRHALNMAVEYASEREVFGQPIGAHQALHHPLADAHADLELASLMTEKAAWLYDHNGDAAAAANMAKLKGAEAAWNACEAAMTTFGGMSIASEVGLAAAWQYVRHLRIAPVSEEMIRNYLGEHVLGLPRSY